MNVVLRVFKRINGLSETEGVGTDTLAAGGAACSIRLLVASSQAINLIGKQGSLIKSIQESSTASIRVLSGGVRFRRARVAAQKLKIHVPYMEDVFSLGIPTTLHKSKSDCLGTHDIGQRKSDARALRTILSLIGVKEGLIGHIVVELSDLDNEVLVKLVGGELVETVVAHDVISL